MCSVYYQPNSSRRGGPLSRPPAGCALGSVGNPFDRVWPPTMSSGIVASGVPTYSPPPIVLHGSCDPCGRPVRTRIGDCNYDPRAHCAEAEQAPGRQCAPKTSRSPVSALTAQRQSRPQDARILSATALQSLQQNESLRRTVRRRASAHNHLHQSTTFQCMRRLRPPSWIII